MHQDVTQSTDQHWLQHADKSAVASSFFDQSSAHCSLLRLLQNGIAHVDVLQRVVQLTASLVLPFRTHKRGMLANTTRTQLRETPKQKWLTCFFQNQHGMTLETALPDLSSRGQKTIPFGFAYTHANSHKEEQIAAVLLTLCVCAAPVCETWEKTLMDWVLD